MKPTVALFREMLYEATPADIVGCLYRAVVEEKEAAEIQAVLAQTVMKLDEIGGT